MSKQRRVVITGLGMVSPLGLTVAESWDGIIKSRSGVTKVEMPRDDIPVKIAAIVKNFDASQFMPVKDIRKTDIFIQYGLAAAIEAVKDAGIVATPENEYRIGVAVGSGIGGLPMIETSHSILMNHGFRRLSPFFVPGSIINMVSGYISMQFGFKGPNISIVTACTTGSHNLGYAARTIAYGDADVMIAGGSEMATCEMGLAGFAAARALSKRNDAPEQASRPWDKDRDGFVLGEGSGVLVLEDYEFAKKRGAKIYAELVGFGMSGDAYHITSPDPEGTGFVVSMENAIRDAALKPEQIDYINAHGTSTQTGDIIEAAAVKKTFGKHAYNLSISSTKSMTGHLLGAAGSVEAIFSILALRDQIAPPTLNLDNPDEGCDLDFVAHKAKSRSIEVVLSNSFGFGGTNATLIFKKFV